MAVRGLLLRGVLVLFGLALCLSPSLAAEPALRNLDLRGLEIGGTTTLLIDGDDLGAAPRLLLPFPAKVEFKAPDKPNDKRAQFAVTLDGDVAPGYYSLRVVTDEGVSLPAVVAVDRLPQRTLSVSPAVSMPIALHGAVSGQQIAEVRFVGKASQKVKIEVEAQRLGSKLRPILHLYNARRRQIAWSWTTPALTGDTRIETTLADDGEYAITVHDAEYAAPAPGFFRLRIGDWSSVDQVFPPVIGQGQTQGIELVGPAGPMKIDLPASAPGILPIPFPKEGIWSGPRPAVTISSRRELLEQPGASPQELPAGSLGVSGRLAAPLEEDRYRIAVTPGSRLRLEVQAERLGSPLDTAIMVRNEKGDLLQRGEDGPGTVDPVLDYAVPGNVNALVIGVLDAQGRGGPRGVYRLAIDLFGAGASAAGTDYDLETPAQRVTLPVGGRVVVPVYIDRRGYPGAVELSAAGLPRGVSWEGASIPYAADGALVTFVRGEEPCEPSITTWQGRVPELGERIVLADGHPLEKSQPWMASEIAVAPSSAKAADFQIAWRDLPEDAALVLAGKRSLPFKVSRPEGKTTVRLVLLTSQTPPTPRRRGQQQDPNRTLRAEKAVELAVGAADGELVAIVPADLSAPVYDVTLQAELLNEGKKVLATAFATVRRMTVRNPLGLKVAAARLEATADVKTPVTVKLQGEIERLDGATGDAVLTLAGLPAGVRVEPGTVTLKGDQKDFSVNVILPPNFAAGEYSTLKLSGLLTPDPKQPNVRVKSRDVELTLVVMSAAK